MWKYIALGLVFALVGCGKTFYQHTDGENDMIGVRLPTESEIQLDVVHHINGSTITVKDPSNITHEYTVATSNSYLWGMVVINERRTGDVTVSITNEVECVK